MAQAIPAWATLMLLDEEDRRRLAEELHDDPIQRMTGLQLHLGLVERRLEGHAQQAVVAELQDHVAAAIGSARRFMVALHPVSLERGDLSGAIREYVDESLVGHPVEVTIQDHAHGVPSAVATTIFRIAREAIDNIRRHAAAKHVSVFLEARDGGVLLLVRDDGQGFASPHERQQESGLQRLRGRAAIAGGWAVVSAMPRRGTLVASWIPLEASEDIPDGDGALRG